MVTSRTACTPPKATLMFRISTSGTRSATVMAASTSAAAAAVVGVEADGHDQDDAGDDVLGRRVDADEAQAVGERLHHEGAQDGARDGADAAGERGPADDGRGDDVQLVALPTSSVAPLSRADATAAAIAQSRPISMYVFMIVQRVLMPASSAASGLPP